MYIFNLIIYFVAGGLFTTIIVVLEESGQKVLSGLATLIPVFTLIAYFFIGQTSGGRAVGQHAKFVLIGTLISWVPYMLAIIYLAPRIGPHKAILMGLIIFFVFALLYIVGVSRFGFFQ
jgi:uncharacterized membrane protein (GlpM family)